MSARHSKGRAKFRLGAATAVGAAVAITGVAGAGTAFARPVSLTLKYTCTASGATAPVTLEINSDVSASVAVNERTPKFPVSVAAKVNATQTGLLNRAGVKSVEGWADATVGVTAPQGNRQVPVRFTVHNSVPGSGSFKVTARGTTPSLTFSKPGTGHLTAVTDINVHVTARDASGKALGSSNGTCTPQAGQPNVVASFVITGKGQTNGSSTTSGTSSTPAPRAAATPASRKSTNGLTATRALAATGQDTGDVVLLAVASLAAGATAFSVGARWKNLRRTADDN
jgi:hypothetical protein